MYGLLTELMQSLMILATFAIPIVYFAPEQALVLFGLAVFALAATAWIRSACRHIWQFALLGLVIVALPLVLPILPPFSVTIWPRLITVRCCSSWPFAPSISGSSKRKKSRSAAWCSNRS
jgi:hypothetical protein